jgi:N-acetylglucosaminyldiphosphoundecaprenol N-acetyl-beta-D-mannosaminyltransferase
VAPLRVAAGLLAVSAAKHRGLQVHLCNAFTLALASNDSDLQRVLLAADLNLADGVPVAWLGRKQGLRQPVRGSWLFSETCKVGVGHGLKHFLLGGDEGVAEKMAARVEAELPGVHVVGVYSPKYGALDDGDVAAFAERIRASGADIVWLGLGTPKQDLMVERLALRLPSAVIVPIGAVFDFWAGRRLEAPPWLQGTGFEWAYRFAQEPRRLWKRYLLGNVRFLLCIARARWNLR